MIGILIKNYKDEANSVHLEKYSGYEIVEAQQTQTEVVLNVNNNRIGVPAEYINIYENNQLKTCEACKKYIISTSVIAKNKDYHLDCFVCSTCFVSLAGQQFLSKKGLFFCTQCFSKQTIQKICGGCEKPIESLKYVQAMKSQFHSECFVCAVCKSPFANNTFFPLENKPYCKEHFLEVRAEICAVCGEKILGQGITLKTKKLHKECFLCAFDGHKMLDPDKAMNAEYIEKDEKYYCEHHYKELFLEKCTTCGFSIETEYVKVENNKYHKDCLLCNRCGGNLLEKGITANSAPKKLLCSECVFLDTEKSEEKDFVPEIPSLEPKITNEKPPKLEIIENEKPAPIFKSRVSELKKRYENVS